LLAVFVIVIAIRWHTIVHYQILQTHFSRVCPCQFRKEIQRMCLYIIDKYVNDVLEQNCSFK